MRTLVASLALLAALALPARADQSLAAGGDCLRVEAGVDLQTATIPQLQAAMDAGRLSSRTLVDAYRARIAAYDGELNAVRELDPTATGQAARLDGERAAGRVRGPLHGIPVLLKDNIAADGLALTAGSIALEGVQPRRDATLVRRLRQAGAVILGKVNLSEFAGWVDLDAPPGWSSLAGQVRNAYTFGSPSGSSSGSGVAASMAFAAATIGTETSGSILSPSVANGIVGVKTSLGLVSRAGILPLAPSFDVPGPMVRSVTDAALILEAIAGPDAFDPATAGAPAGRFDDLMVPGALQGVRLAYSESARSGLSSSRRALFDKAIAQLRELGATVVGVRALDAQYAGLAEIGAIPNEFKASLNAFLAQWLPEAAVDSLGEVVAHARANQARYPYGQTLLEASDLSPGAEAIFPAQAAPARAAAGAVIDAALAEADADAIIAPGNAHANVGAAAGYPTVLVPQGALSDGRSPQGLGFLGRPLEERALLGYAYAYEQAARARVIPTDVNPDLVAVACG